MTKFFGNTLAVRPTFQSANSANMPTDKILKTRFQFFSAVLQNYIAYSQDVENLSRAETQQRVMKMADSLVEKYKFGSKFISDLNRHINDRYSITAVELNNKIKADAGVEDASFESLMSEFQKSEVFEGFSPRFKRLLN